MDILSDGKPIGTIIRRGVPVILKPESFGPGFAPFSDSALSRYRWTDAGHCRNQARLQEGTNYIITVVVE